MRGHSPSNRHFSPPISRLSVTGGSMVREPGGKLIACFAGTKRQRAGHLAMPSPVVNVTLNLCECQAAFSRRRSSNPSDPKTRARTLPRLLGSISGTDEGLLAGLARRKPMKLNSNDGSPKKPSEDDREN